MARSGISKHLHLLQESGKIKHIGPNKGGHWEVIEEQERIINDYRERIGMQNGSFVRFALKSWHMCHFFSLKVIIQ